MSASSPRLELGNTTLEIAAGRRPLRFRPPFVSVPLRGPRSDFGGLDSLRAIRSSRVTGYLRQEDTPGLAAGHRRPPSLYAWNETRMKC